MRRFLSTIACGAVVTASCLEGGETSLSETVISDVPRLIERVQAGPYGTIWRQPDFAPVRNLVEAQVAAWFSERQLDPSAILSDLKSVVFRGNPATLVAPEAAGGFFALRLPTRGAEVQQALDGLDLGGGIGPMTVVQRGEWVLFGAGAEQAPAITIPAAAQPSDTYSVLDWSALLEHPETPKETVAIMRALGLRGMVQQVQLDQQGTREELTLPGFKPPLMACDPQVLSSLPKEQLLVAAFAIDGVQLSSLLTSLGTEVPTIAQTLAGWDDQAKQNNLPSTDAVLRGWKGTVWFSVAPAAPFPTVTLGIPASAELDRVLMFPSAAGKVDLAAARQDAVVIPLPPNAPFLLQVRRTADQWVVSTDQRVMDALASGTPGGYAAPEFPATGTVAFYTQDTAGILRAGLGYLPLVMQAVPANAGADFNKMVVGMIAKAANAALPHLQPTVATMQVDADGVRIGGTNLTMGSVPLGVLAGALLPAISQVRQMARQTQSGKNMTQIYGAMIAWSTIEETWPPPSFAELAKQQSLPAKLFRSPSDPTHPSPYLFITPKADPPASQPVLIEDPACYRNQGTMVCFGDAHVKWISRAKAQRLWQEATRLAALPKATMGGIELADWVAVNDILGLDPVPEKSVPSPAIP